MRGRDLTLELHISGGYGGLRQQPVRVDTATLEPAERERVERMAGQVDWRGLEARSPLRGRGADRFQYRVVVDGPDAQASVVAAEDAVPADLKPVVDWLLERR